LRAPKRGAMVSEHEWIIVNLIQQYEMAHPYPGLAPFIYAADLVAYLRPWRCSSTGCSPAPPRTAFCTAGPISACVISFR
jgi:hypothetical protein